MTRTNHLQPRLAAVVVAATVAVVVATGMPAATAARPQHVLFGSHVSPRWGLRQQDAIKHFEAMIGRKLAIVDRFLGFSQTSMGFAVHVSAQGRIPMISWRAVDHKDLDPNRAAKIARGDFDQQIRRFANAVKAVHRSVLIRFAWEMTAGPGNVQYIGKPADFIRAWRHVVSLFRQQGAGNARFVWAPRARSFCNGKGLAYYPGNAWVNWIGASAVPYNTWSPFRRLFGCFYSWAAPHAKPLLAWVGVRERPGDPQWKARFLNGARRAIGTSMQKLSAFVYFNSTSNKANHWADSSAASFRAYKTMACGQFFNRRFGC